MGTPAYASAESGILTELAVVARYEDVVAASVYSLTDYSIKLK